MRKYFNILLSIMIFSVINPVSTLYAADKDAIETEAVTNKAHQLKELLDHLLLDSNHSSIQKIIKEGDEPIKALIADAFRLKNKGEQLLTKRKYMDAAVSLQSALELVFKAIRQDEEEIKAPDIIDSKLTENIRVNDTFITTATRVVNNGSNNDAVELLQKAREARERADEESSKGKKDIALLELEHSTRLAQQAIMKVRNGMVIERGQ